MTRERSKPRTTRLYPCDPARLPRTRSGSHLRMRMIGWTRACACVGAFLYRRRARSLSLQLSDQRPHARQRSADVAVAHEPAQLSERQHLLRCPARRADWRERRRQDQPAGGDLAADAGSRPSPRELRGDYARTGATSGWAVAATLYAERRGDAHRHGPRGRRRASRERARCASTARRPRRRSAARLSPHPVADAGDGRPLHRTGCRSAGASSTGWC